MAAPTFIQEAETTYDSLAPPKSTASVSGLADDLLVMVGYTQALSNTLVVSNDGAALTWTQVQLVDDDTYASVYIWKHKLVASRSVIVTLTRTGSLRFGGNLYHWRNASDVGASNQGFVDSGAGGIALTTTAPDSAIMFVAGDGDWAATDGAGRAYDTGQAGAFTEQTYNFGSGALVCYGGYYANAGAAGGKLIGLTNPTSHFSLAAVEILGVTAQPATPSGILTVPYGAKIRARPYYQRAA